MGSSPTTRTIDMIDKIIYLIWSVAIGTAIGLILSLNSFQMLVTILLTTICHIMLDKWL